MLFGARMNQKQNQEFVNIIFGFLGDERPVNPWKDDGVVKTTITCHVRKNGHIGLIMIEENVNGKTMHRHGLQKSHWCENIPYGARVARRHMEKILLYASMTGKLETAKLATATLKSLNEQITKQADDFTTNRWYARTIRKKKDPLKISV